MNYDAGLPAAALQARDTERASEAEAKEGRGEGAATFCLWAPDNNGPHHFSGFLFSLPPLPPCHSGNWLKIEQLFIPSLARSRTFVVYFLGPHSANCHFDSNDCLGVTGDSFSSFRGELRIFMSSSAYSLAEPTRGQAIPVHNTVPGSHYSNTTEPPRD